MHSVLRIANGRFREGAMRAIAPPFKENFSIFCNKNEQKNEFTVPRMNLKKSFLSMITSPFEKSAALLLNF